MTKTKKTLTILLAAALVLSAAGSVFAEKASYTKSPTAQGTPQIRSIEVVSEDPDALKIEIVKNEKGIVQFKTGDGEGPAADDCIVTLKLTPYAEKHTIENVVCKVTDGTGATGEVSAEKRLEYARTNQKNGTDSLGASNFKLWRDAIDKAAKAGIAGAKDAKAKVQNKDIVIVTLFDVSVWCEKPEQHDLVSGHCIHNIRLTFGDDEMSSLLNNYAALMHYNGVGEWVYVPSTISEDPITKEDVIEFQIDCEDLSPFAIAAFSSQAAPDEPVSPQTGVESHAPLYIGIAACILICAAVYAKSRRKEER